MMDVMIKLLAAEINLYMFMLIVDLFMMFFSYDNIFTNIKAFKIKVQT